MIADSLTLEDIAHYLAEKLTTDRYPPQERGGIVKASNRPVYRLGLALEPFPAMGEWLEINRIDALWLHRPWQLDPGTLPGDVGIMYHHLPFDEHLTIGYNLPLAEALTLYALQPIGFKQSRHPDGETLPPRPIGMLAEAPEQPFEQWQKKLKATFGGFDETVAGRSTGMARVAVVGAMSDTLVREAAELGATLYVTGQYRPSAKQAVQKTGIGVIAIGHHRSELWGLHALQRLVQPLVNTWLKE